MQKAMSKFRDERYSTAREFADDLRRFLDGKPTVAKRPTMAGLATKWICRHKVVASFVAVLVVAVLGLLASTGMLAQRKRETDRALAKAEDNFQQYRAQLADCQRVILRCYTTNRETHKPRRVRLKRRYSFNERSS